MRQEVRDLMNDIQTDMESLGCKPAELYLFIDDDKDWLKILERSAGPDVNIKTLTDTKYLNVILRENGKSRLIIDVRMPDITGISLAEKMNLKDRADKLIFVSAAKISEHEMQRVESMGAQFILKSPTLWQDVKQACTTAT